jgi:hypothetical protein
VEVSRDRETYTNGTLYMKLMNKLGDNALTMRYSQAWRSRKRAVRSTIILQNEINYRLKRRQWQRTNDRKARHVLPEIMIWAIEPGTSLLQVLDTHVDRVFDKRYQRAKWTVSRQEGWSKSNDQRPRKDGFPIPISMRI